MPTKGTLYIVATPIGNLQDMTQRAIMTLEMVDLILAEDTRTTKRLIDRFGDLHHIDGQLLRLDDHVQGVRLLNIVDQIDRGATAALVSEAGTPQVSDPGASLIRECLKRQITIIPVPGPSALTTILSIADFHTQPAAFYGFLPRKKGRQTTLKGLKAMAENTYGPASAIIYESPERLLRTLSDLGEALGPTTHIVIGRELTKLHEELWYGKLADALDHFKKPRGEFTLLVQLAA